ATDATCRGARSAASPPRGGSSPWTKPFLRARRHPGGEEVSMRPDPFHDPLQFLSACHGRIRLRLFAFLQAAARLRAPGTIERHEVEAALLFFRTSGEGHTVDEEQSLFPRLRPRLEAAGAQEAIEALD